MTVVDKDAFFAVIMALDVDVHPCIVNTYEHRGRGYISEWRTQDTSRRLIGVSESGDRPFTQPRWCLMNEGR